MKGPPASVHRMGSGPKVDQIIVSPQNLNLKQLTQNWTHPEGGVLRRYYAFLCASGVPERCWHPSVPHAWCLSSDSVICSISFPGSLNQFFSLFATENPNAYSTQGRNPRIILTSLSAFCIQLLAILCPACLSGLSTFQYILHGYNSGSYHYLSELYKTPLLLPPSPHGNFPKMQIRVLKNYNTTMDAVKLCSHILLLGV